LPNLRIALGASSGGVMRLVLGRVTVLIALGIAVAGAAIVLAVIGVAAGAVPVWRAARVDPTTVMRSL
jgi:hypothetical protein